MNTRFGLDEEDINKMIDVLKRYGEVKEVVIYGSRAKGTQRSGSDIDLTLTGNLDWQTFSRLENDLDDLLLPYEIDLSLFDQIDNPELKAQIKQTGQILYCR